MRELGTLAPFSPIAKTPQGPSAVTTIEDELAQELAQPASPDD